MQINPDAPTWRFALGEAFDGIRRLVWHFDFDQERRNANYAGIPNPNELVVVIDGFLDERQHLPGGDVANLEKAKLALQQDVAMAYQAGQQTAHESWINSTPEARAQLAQLMPDDVMATAWTKVPADLTDSNRNWFVEGFCRKWWLDEYVSYVRSTG